MEKLTLWVLLLAAPALTQEPANLGVFEGSCDVGAPSHKGSVVFDQARREYRVTGGGANMWAKRDDFFFVWRKITGDVAVGADMTIASGGAPHRKAGLMIRKSFEPDAVYADAVVHGEGLTSLQFRDQAGDITRGLRFPMQGPTRIRLERRGIVVSMWTAAPGGAWQEAGSTEVRLGDPVYVGLAVCAHDDKAETTAVFSNLTIEKLEKR